MSTTTGCGHGEMYGPIKGRRAVKNCHEIIWKNEDKLSERGTS
jgi:hypothetical protein